MRATLVRLAAVVVGVAVVMSCDNSPVNPKFGNGISGGTSGTSPITPPNPNSPDTTKPFARIDTPVTANLLFNVGDSIFTAVTATDDRSVASLEITGLKIIGDSTLGTLTKIVRYTSVPTPAPGQTIAPGTQLLRVRRYLQPVTPLDTTVGPMTIIAVIRDAAGNVDTSRRVVQIVTGPKVTILAPVNGDTVAQGVAMRIQIHITHQDGVRSDTIRIKGDSNFTGAARLDTTFIVNYAGTQRDVLIDTTIDVPNTAPVPGKITVSTVAVDVNRNPGSANPVQVVTRLQGTTIPKVTQTVPLRVELTDSVTVFANGDGIASVGVVVRDSVGTLLKSITQALPAPFTSNARAAVPLLLSDTLQGRRVLISSFATDRLNITGYSVRNSSTAAQSDPTQAFADSAIVVFGHTFPLPRAGIIGDMQVDETRGNVFLSNMSANRLEVWQAPTQAFSANGIAVGSQPWGLARTALSNDSLLVANSGGTNISRVFIGTTVATSMTEDLAARVRTRPAPIWEIIETVDAANRVAIVVKDPLLFSNRPQYIGQIANGQVYFSTRPTSEATKGMIHWFQPATPGFPLPDLHSVVNFKAAGINVPNWMVHDVDSIYVRPALSTSGQPDTLVIWDHTPNTANPSDSIRTINGVSAGAAAIRAKVGSDIVAIPRVDFSTIGYTDTTFVAVSGDHQWVAFGYGNTLGAGNIFMASPGFQSAIIAQTDLTNNAAEHIYGLALDSTGITVAAHGAASYFGSVDPPFHLRLQGKYDTFIHGAGIAFHPAARGATTPVQQRLAFVASDDATIQAMDVAHYLFAGKFPIKTLLYGPLRVSRRFPTDPAPTGSPDDIVLKLYGVTTTGLIVIDVRDRDLKPVP